MPSASTGHSDTARGTDEAAVTRLAARSLAARWKPSPSKTSAALAGVVVICVSGLTMSMTGLAPTLPAVAAAAFLFVIVLMRNPAWMVHATLVVLFTTSVPEIPRGLRVGGVFIYFNEFFIFGSLLYALSLMRKNSTLVMQLRRTIATRLVYAFSLVVLIGLAIAVLRGYPFWDIQYDVKSVVELVVVVFISSVIVIIDDWSRYVKTITSILIFSALLTVYASATGFVLWGRTEAAELYAMGGRAIAGGSTAVRYLTQTTPLALAALSGCVALILIGRVSAAKVTPMLVPALIISILSFSRNTLLAIAGAFIFALLIAVARGNFSRLALRLASVPLVAGLVMISTIGIGSAVGAGNWITTQATGYSNRVIAGFDESNERADTSASYREQENDYILRTGATHPVFGGGFGTHYKPPTGGRKTFPAFEGTMYSHNAYNWLYVKVGLVGVGVFAALIIACALPALNRKKDSTLLQVSASTLAGLSVAILVTPMPIEQPGSALLGIVMGLCIGTNARLDQQKRDSRLPFKRAVVGPYSKSPALGVN